MTQSALRSLAAPAADPQAGCSHQNIVTEQCTTPVVPPDSSPTHAWPPLESFEKIGQTAQACYVGPTDESNWVIPGLLLVGAFPASTDDEENTHLLSSVLACNISTFVCLQLEYAEGVPENMWRVGQGLRPYFNDAVRIAKRMRAHTSTRNLTTKRDLTFVHFPIEDCNVVRVLEMESRMRRTLKSRSRFEHTSHLIAIHDA